MHQHFWLLQPVKRLIPDDMIRNFTLSSKRLRRMDAMSHQRYPTGDVVVSENDLSGAIAQVPGHCCHST